MPGKSKLYNESISKTQLDSEIKKLIAEFQDEYKKCDDDFQLLVDSVYRECAGFMSYDKDKYLSKRKRVCTGITAGVAVAIMPVVILGSLAVIPAAVLIPLGIMLTLGKGAAEALSQGAEGRLDALQAVGNSALKAAELSLAYDTNSFMSSGFSFGLVIPSLKSKAYKQEVTNLLKSDSENLVEKLGIFAAGVAMKASLDGFKDMVKELTSDPLEKKRLLPLAMYLILDENDVGGRHKALINTRYLENIGAQDVKLFKSTAIKLGDGTEFSKWVAKYNDDSFYAKLFPDPDEVKTRNRILIEKARILSHASEYIKSLKGSFGDNFHGYVVDKKTTVLPDCFQLDVVKKRDGSAVLNKDGTVKEEKKDGSSSNKRKAFALGMYAFHSILEKHLGTYNLACLGGFGFNADLDIKVHNALIDALATHAWIETGAYVTGISSRISFTEEWWKKTNVNIVAELPYISAYYNLDVFWKRIGMAIGATIVSCSATAKLLEKDKSALYEMMQNDLSKFLVDSGINKGLVKLDLQMITDDIKAKGLVAKIKSKVLVNGALNFTKYSVKNNVIAGGSLNSGVSPVALHDADLFKLMPTGKERTDKTKDHLVNVISKVLNPYYDKLQNMDAADCLVSIEKGLKIIADFKLTGGTHSERIKGEYGLFNNDPNDLHYANKRLKIKKSLKYMPGANATQASIQTDAENIDDALADRIATLHLGAAASASGGSAILQSDINKLVAETLTLLASRLGISTHIMTGISNDLANKAVDNLKIAVDASNHQFGQKINDALQTGIAAKAAADQSSNYLKEKIRKAKDKLRKNITSAESAFTDKIDISEIAINNKISNAEAVLKAQIDVAKQAGAEAKDEAEKLRSEVQAKPIVYNRYIYINKPNKRK